MCIIPPGFRIPFPSSISPYPFSLCPFPPRLQQPPPPLKPMLHWDSHKHRSRCCCLKLRKATRVPCTVLPLLLYLLYLLPPTTTTTKALRTTLILIPIPTSHSHHQPSTIIPCVNQTAGFITSSSDLAPAPTCAPYLLFSNTSSRRFPFSPHLLLIVGRGIHKIPICFQD